MKEKLLVFLFVISSFGITAQNWTPLIGNQQVTQYVIPTGRQSIQSVVIDTSYQNTTVFMRGYNYERLGNYQMPQVIKGKVLGDTLETYLDSSVFKTIDNSGFELIFPHRYYTGLSWNLGLSHSYQLHATVDSMKLDTVNGFGMDSIAFISIITKSIMGTLASSHPYNNAQIIISKNYGLTKTIDFTEPNRKVEFNLLNWPGTTISKSENFQLSTGDEYHTYHYYYNTIGINNREYIYTVIGDTLINHLRNVTLKRQTKQVSTFGGPTVRTNVTDTIIRILDTTSVFMNRFSSIIKSSSLVGSHYDLSRDFYLRNIVLPVTINEFEIRIQSGRVWLTGTSGQTVEANYRLGVHKNFDIHKIYGGAFHNRSKVVYIKKGNQTWGTPLNLAVGLDNIESNSSDILIYPNPATEELNIKTGQKIGVTEVFNIQGKLVMSFRNEKQLDVSSLQAGIYFIKINTGKGVFTQKFIKQ